ncbi:MULTISPECIES: twin-arginine translocation signal domain-containing protein [Ramlibacter]|uniref:Twin-arginine translocation signal domain-containing protein n=1 Tax=Ramlibacter aquaticus TaxID=2780094 RepID=A0ABR9SF33_9BURK|nr:MULTISPECIES: twin-arginine translocation signal domain-containing protein [Ramlibacter]MBE7940973.1 twin-arginine translocation signal domain-containing protein [Ramlibacter aquaticus]
MDSTQQRSRRGFMLGAAVAGAAAAAVASLASVKRPQAPVAEPEPQPAPPANGGGYRVSEHIQRYYKSARI